MHPVFDPCEKGCIPESCLSRADFGDGMHFVGKLSDQTSVRFTPEELTAVRAFAKSENAKLGDVIRLFVTEGMTSRTGKPHEVRSLVIGGDDFVSVPLVAANVAAGHGAIPELPEDRRVYAFRRDYVRRAIGTGDPRDGTLVTVFLARNKSLGSSMLPTIQPGSLILVDRRPVERIKDRGIYLIEYPDLAEEHGLAVKRLTLEKRKAILVAESDNPEPRYYPRIIDLDGVRISDIVKGRVILWSTEADEA